MQPNKPLEADAATVGHWRRGSLVASIVVDVAIPAVVRAAQQPIRQAGQVTIQDLGSIGELVGAVATVATLLYLATQIRQNSRLMRAQLTIATREGRSEATRLLASDKEASRVFWEGLESRTNLSDEDRRQFDPIITLMVNHWHEVLTYDSDFDGEDHDWSRDWNVIIESNGFGEWWSVYGANMPRYVQAYVEPRFPHGEPAAQHGAAADST